MIKSLRTINFRNVIKIICDHPCTTLFFITLLFHVILSYNITLPIIFGDEPTTLVYGSFLSPGDFSWESIYKYPSYYGYGQTLLLTPLFWIIKDNILLYKTIIFVIALFSSFIPVLAYKILILINKKSEKIFLLFAFVVGMFPAYLIYSKSAWNEGLISLLVWIIAYLLLKNLNEESKKKFFLRTLLISFLSIYGYATHGRFLVIVIAMLSTAVFSAHLLKIKTVNIPVLLGSMLIFIYLDSIIKSFFMINIWRVETLNNTLGSTITNILPKLFNENGFKRFVTAIITYVFHVNFISFGLTTISIIFLIKKIVEIVRKKNNQSPLFVFFSLYAILCIIGSILISILFFSEVLLLGKDGYNFYGRYMEYTIPLAILSSLYGLWKYKPLKQIVIPVFLVNITSYIFTYFLSLNMNLSQTNYYCLQMLCSFSPSGKIYIPQELFQVIVGGLILNLIIWSIYYFTNKNSIYLLSLSLFVIFSFSSYKGTNVVRYHSDDNFNRVHTSYTFFEEINKLNSSLKSDYDIYLYISSNTPIGLYYTFSHRPFTVLAFGSFAEREQYIYEEAQAYIPENAFVISDTNYLEYIRSIGIDNLGDFYEVIIQNRYNTERIWIKGAELAEKITELGYECIKISETMNFYAYDFYIHNANQEDFFNEKIIPIGSFIYGPYIDLSSGEYQVTVRATEPDLLSVLQIKGFSKDTYESIEIFDFSFVGIVDGELLIQFVLDDDLSDIQILLNNESDEDILLESISITDIS